MSSFCTSTYTGVGSQWPVRAFPASSFPRDSPARSRAAARAWNFFEQVEAFDAAVSVKYSNMGGYTAPSVQVTDPNPWYMFKDESERILYRRGRALHHQLCPGIDWKPQRELGIPKTPLVNVGPFTCS